MKSGNYAKRYCDECLYYRLLMQNGYEFYRIDEFDGVKFFTFSNKDTHLKKELRCLFDDYCVSEEKAVSKKVADLCFGFIEHKLDVPN